MNTTVFFEYEQIEVMARFVVKLKQLGATVFVDKKIGGFEVIIERV